MFEGAAKRDSEPIKKKMMDQLKVSSDRIPSAIQCDLDSLPHLDLAHLRTLFGLLVLRAQFGRKIILRFYSELGFFGEGSNIQN
jgi:hypothetical protein